MQPGEANFVPGTEFRRRRCQDDFGRGRHVDMRGRPEVKTVLTQKVEPLAVRDI